MWVVCDLVQSIDTYHSRTRWDTSIAFSASTIRPAHLTNLSGPSSRWLTRVKPPNWLPSDGVRANNMFIVRDWGPFVIVVRYKTMCLLAG